MPLIDYGNTDQRINLCVTSEQLTRLDAAAQRAGHSRSSAVREAIEEWLGRRESRTNG